MLGSGWGRTAAHLGPSCEPVEQGRLPGFARTSIPGHAATVSSVRLGTSGRSALVFSGRTHAYEGLGVRAVVHAVRTAAAAGCRAVVLTNGCGSLNPAWGPGTPVLISDHINLTGLSPLEGPEFVDLTDLYSPRLRALARRSDPGLEEGVYVQFRGPHYETPAEVRMAGIMGGSLVGMSTALEAIAARHLGLEVLGVSLVTNAAAGVTGTPLRHDEVLGVGRASAERCGRLLADVVANI